MELRHFMKKKNNKGFMLLETLIVTIFVATVLIFLFIQFTNLNKSYDESYIYNTTEGLYALEDVKRFLKSEEYFSSCLEDYGIDDAYIDITDCNSFEEIEYCLSLFEAEKIEKILITDNEIDKENIKDFDEGFLTFINKINKEGSEPYRLVAQFSNDTYATLRLGDADE